MWLHVQKDRNKYARKSNVSVLRRAIMASAGGEDLKLEKAPRGCNFLCSTCIAHVDNAFG